MADAISQLQGLLAKSCKILKVQPAVFASDAEVNIVTVTVACPDGVMHTIRAYREEAQALREFVRTKRNHNLESCYTRLIQSGDRKIMSCLNRS